MRITYHPDTDALFIDLTDTSESTHSREVAHGVLVELDDQDNPVGIEIESASKFIDFGFFDVMNWPAEINIGQTTK